MKPAYDFHYSHLLPRKPGVIPLDTEVMKQCRRCGAEFVTRSRAQKRCEVCAPIAAAETQKRNTARTTARRKAARQQ